MKEPLNSSTFPFKMVEMEGGEDEWTKLIVKYVGQKVSKVRWMPSQYGLMKCDKFVSGSWDDQVRKAVFVWAQSSSILAKT